uniref:VTT domain-containing protein n=3 Tax=Hemiselmis andersenii TaxID=464988 RepID=A0A6U4TDB1_HEMAN|mmetsp:Transcript_26323/g.60986  ORF Transcript_26323/g.60986 Transcript_26323/m.60986 type:complete len:383 (-) Transcript_26323:240-1388(-)
MGDIREKAVIDITPTVLDQRDGSHREWHTEKSPPMGGSGKGKSMDALKSRPSHSSEVEAGDRDSERQAFLGGGESGRSQSHHQYSPSASFNPSCIPCADHLRHTSLWTFLSALFRSGMTRQVLLLALLFSIIWASIFIFFLPVMDAEDRARLKVPSTLAEVRETYAMLGEYRTKHYTAVMMGFSAAYLMKMALALPGSPLFNLLGGALFGVHVGFPLCLACISVGTALCYLVFNTIGGPFVRRLFVEQLARLDEGVRHHRRRLFYYLTVIRIFPMTPNFFINLAAPLIRLPIVPHVAAATCGLSPMTFLTCQAGMTLSKLHSVRDAVDKRVILSLGAIAVVSAVPLVLRRRVERSLESLTDTTPVVLPEELRVPAGERQTGE